MLRIIGFLIILVCGGYVFTKYRTEIAAWVAVTFSASRNEETIPVLTLKRDSLQVEMPAEGEIVGLESVPIAARKTGAGSLTLAWLVPEGTMAAPGEQLIRFDDTDTLLNLESQNNTLDENRLQAEIDEGDQQLTGKGLEIEQAAALMDYEYSTKTLPEDTEIFTQWEIINARVDAEFAKAKVDNLAAKAKTLKRQSRSAQQISALTRNRAQAEVDILTQSLSTMEVKAPAGGLVVYRRDRRQDPNIGDSFQAGQVLIDLVDLSALQARIYVLEKEAGGLAKGKPVTIKLDALPDRVFHGEVQSVSAVAAAIERNGVLKYFTCDVTIRDAEAFLGLIRPGMKLQARVILVNYDSCFVVPASALDYVEKENKTYVYIRNGTDYEKREVTLGLGRHGQATILSGVNDEELIALSNPFQVRKLTLPDFSKPTTVNQQRRGGPGGSGMDGTPAGGRGR